MSDISKIALNGVTYDVKDETARREKVTADGGDISNTKVSAFEASTASFPVPAAGEKPKTLWGKTKKFCEDFINFKSQIVTKAMILNQIINDAEKVASMAAVFSVNERVTTLNNNLTDIYNPSILTTPDTIESYADSLPADGKTYTRRYSAPSDRPNTDWGVVEVTKYNSFLINIRAMSFAGGKLYTKTKNTTWGGWEKDITNSDLDSGIETFTNLTAGGITQKTISYHHTISPAPTVIAIPVTSSFDADVRIRSSTTTGFIVDIKLPVSMTTLSVAWQAK